MKRGSLICFLIASLLVILLNCNSEEKSPYLNINDNKAQYVGMQTCRSCHWQVYETFIKTGMGQSWGIANKEKSAADFSPAKALVYDSVKDFYYKPYWDGDSLTIMEYRLAGKDTVHQRFEKVSYIVGSGQHTNSHIININGYLHQAPITFYTQKGKWDLAPGFEKGLSSRFDRKIEMECISCHNGYPELVAGSLNKYAQVQVGIDCERCHGPGSLHVSQKQQGIIVDTSQTADYTIVNPRRLNIEEQNNLCQRCHLQGITVLNDGKSFFDFKPSEKLSKTMNTFMPNYSSSENHMIMASHVERMKMSTCYVNSGKMSCITCHNPHVSVKYTPETQYINACNSCHTSKDACTETLEKRNAKQNNCLSCHMPKNGSIDIPHVAVTDHFIRKRPLLQNSQEVSKFISMICYSNDQPDARTRARAFLEFYERYEPAKLFLDSALSYLEKAGVNKEKDADYDLLRIYFLQEKYAELVTLVKDKKGNDFTDAWTCYRIGESYLKLGNTSDAIPYLQQSVALKKYALDFQNKLGNAFLQAKKITEAKQVFMFIVSENPRNAEAQSGLGYIAMQAQNIPLAKKYLTTSVMLNPDHVQTLINLAVVFYQSNERQYIKPLLSHALKLEPENVQVNAMLADLGK
ncbi:MAG: pilus assembly protein TadD [Bacteroidetes bacterium]|nr:pilus assembly protein TadD [Bacteroidota bacterium]